MTEFAEIDLPRSLFACIAGGLLAWLHLRALSWSLHRFEAGAHGEASLLMSGVGRVALVSAGFLALCGGFGAIGGHCRKGAERYPPQRAPPDSNRTKRTTQ